MATRYSVSVINGWSSEGIALFADTADLDAMIDFCVKQFISHNSPIENITIVDLETGELLWNYADTLYQPAEPQDIDSDCGFDPYLGYFTDNC